MYSTYIEQSMWYSKYYCMFIFRLQYMLKLTDLKGQCHEIFTFFYSLIEPIWAPDKQAKMVFLKYSFSQRYSNSTPRSDGQPFKKLIKNVGCQPWLYIFLILRQNTDFTNTVCKGQHNSKLACS